MLAPNLIKLFRARLCFKDEAYSAPSKNGRSLVAADMTVPSHAWFRIAIGQFAEPITYLYLAAFSDYSCAPLWAGRWCSWEADVEPGIA